MTDHGGFFRSIFRFVSNPWFSIGCTAAGLLITGLSHSGVVDSKYEGVLSSVGIMLTAIGAGTLGLGVLQAAGLIGTTFTALDGLSLTIGICGSTFDLCDWLRKNISR